MSGAGGQSDGNDHARVPLRVLFTAFLKITLSGFGGTLPWAHRVLVNDRRWLTQREFVDALSLCQFLPGPNVVNLSIVVGQRFRGIPGAVAAFSGLVATPALIMIGLGMLYGRYGHRPVIDHILNGISAAAAGLVWAMAIEMSRSFARVPRAIVFTAAAFVASGLLQLPILPVIGVLAPLSVAVAWRNR